MTLIYCDFLDVGLWAKMLCYEEVYGVMENLECRYLLSKLDFKVKGPFREGEVLASELSILY